MVSHLLRTLGFVHTLNAYIVMFLNRSINTKGQMLSKSLRDEYHLKVEETIMDTAVAKTRHTYMMKVLKSII